METVKEQHAVLYMLEMDKSVDWAVATGIWKPAGTTETLNLLNFECHFIVTVFFCHIHWCLFSRQIQGNFTFILEENNHLSDS